MALQVQESQLEQIRQHGSSTYPYECCGLLLGRALSGDDKALVEVWPVANQWQVGELDGETTQRRYLIPPEAVREGEGHARQQGLEIIGYYHSHPDHPARPSEFDREFAWPWYSYVIVAVHQGTPVDLTSWVLDEERQFCPELLQL